MVRRAASVFILVALTAFATVGLTSPAGVRASPDALVVHEWGTFTTVAGEDGRAIDWLPLGGPTDLPCFVEHFNNQALIKIAPGAPQVADYATARATLRAKVRMETPVLYFY